MPQSQHLPMSSNGTSLPTPYRSSEDVEGFICVLSATMKNPPSNIAPILKMGQQQLTNPSTDASTDNVSTILPQSPCKQHLCDVSCTFTRRRGRWMPAKQHLLRNSLLAGVGYLEFANALDFPANVWNETPVPTFAVVLMAIGGTIIILMSTIAFMDARLSWSNLCLLRHERQDLRSRTTTSALEKGTMTRDDLEVASLLDVNSREMGTEIIDRVGMDLLMGFGAILVGIGTLLAIGGANHKVWFASNLLSGYIGNSTVAIYGLANTAWSIYIWRRATGHGTALAKEVRSERLESHIERRLLLVKVHALVNGLTGLIAGAGSLITATRWWGYVILAPCLVSSICCNYFWRKSLGYGRSLHRGVGQLFKDSLLEQLELAIFARQVLLDEKEEDPISRLVPDSTLLAPLLEFIVSNDLFEDTCMDILRDEQLSVLLADALDSTTLNVVPQQLMELDSVRMQRVIEIARACIIRAGPRQFLYRERFLIELIGCYLSREGSAQIL